MLFNYTNKNNLSLKSENYNQILFTERTEVETKSDCTEI